MLRSLISTLSLQCLRIKIVKSSLRLYRSSPFIEANKSLATEANLKILFAMFKDEDGYIRSLAIQIITFSLRRINPCYLP